MQYRHELKLELNYLDYLTLRSRLAAVMKKDAHIGENGRYRIRSLYFDNPENKVLNEKLLGVKDREKFRIRCYNDDYDFIRLEKKVKHGDLGYKLSAPVSREQLESILSGHYEKLLKDNNPEKGVLDGCVPEKMHSVETFSDQTIPPLLVEFCQRVKSERLAPKVIVDYIREPYIYEAGNVRVTIDYDIRSGLSSIDFMNKDLPTIPVAAGVYILEVKYDNFLPDVIRDILQLNNRQVFSFSKYAACRGAST